jgi:SPP1 family predicted phage head-tail adaptor
MSAGQLRHRVELQSQVDTVDDIGQPSTSWLTVATVWADIRYQTGLSAIKSGADVSVVRASIRMRHRAVNAGQRITHDGVVFNIEAVQRDVRGAYVDVVCEVLNAQVS